VAGLVARLKQRAFDEGFDAVGFAPAADDGLAGERLHTFLARGYHGDMAWMAETVERRVSPVAMWPEARTAVVLAISYGPEGDPLARLGDKGAGVVSVYALGRDYHEVVKGKLKHLAQWLAGVSGANVKVFVDTAPLMEKPLAQSAGLGWQGKHTNLVSRQLGSWFFIGTILTDAVLAADAPEADHCGSCRACLDICPTRAFPAPYQLDARRCISYLTIEHKGHIAEEFRSAIGNRIFGCDDCLAACPWNKFASLASETKLRARPALARLALADLLALDEPAFRRLFAASPVKRTGHERFLRNVLIAAGNSGDPGLVAQVHPHLGNASPLVRAMAVWALSRLLPPGDFAMLSDRHRNGESDAAVAREWESR